MTKPDYCPKGFEIEKYDICSQFNRAAWVDALMLREFKVIPIESDSEKLEDAFWRRQEYNIKSLNRSRHWRGRSSPAVESMSISDILFLLEGYDKDSHEIEMVRLAINQSRDSEDGWSVDQWDMRERQFGKDVLDAVICSPQPLPIKSREKSVT